MRFLRACLTTALCVLALAAGLAGTITQVAVYGVGALSFALLLIASVRWEERDDALYYEQRIAELELQLQMYRQRNGEHADVQP